MYKKQINSDLIMQTFLGSVLSLYFVYISILSSLTVIPTATVKSNEPLRMYLQSLINISKVLHDFDTNTEEHGMELNFEDDIDLFHSDYESLLIEQIEFNTKDFKHHFEDRISEKIAIEVTTPPPDFS